MNPAAGALLAIPLAVLAAAPASAGSTSAAMDVSIVVSDSCHVGARPLVFGAAPAGPAQADARSSVMLACTPGTDYVVTLDDGRHGAGGVRRMADASGAAFLAYDIYRDAARTRRWGASTWSAAGGTAPAEGTVELAVYARLSAANEARAGAYGDTVTVTVSF